MSTEDRPWCIGGHELDAEEIADIVWLASFLGEVTTHEPDSRSEAGSTEFSEQRADGKTAVDSAEKKPGDHRKDASNKSAGVDASADHQGRLYAPSTFGGSGRPNTASSLPLTGTSFPTPRAPGLIEKNALMRSLRPLLQRQPSSRHFEMDEEETAQRIASALGHGWAPAMRPLAERMFDLVLLIEDSPSMGVWQDTVQDLRVLLIQTGIFRDVHTWAMVLEESDTEDNARVANMSLRVAHAVPGMGRRSYEPRELIDSQQRRLILVISDCSSLAWDNRAAVRLLKPLAETNALSILQVLPEELWGTTALTNAVRVRVSSRQIVTSDGPLEVHSPAKGPEWGAGGSPRDPSCR